MCVLGIGRYFDTSGCYANDDRYIPDSDGGNCLHAIEAMALKNLALNWLLPLGGKRS